jgi:hypothetical protein
MSDKLRPISMKVLLIMRFNEAPLSINVLATLCRPFGILMTSDRFLSDSWSECGVIIRPLHPPSRLDMLSQTDFTLKLLPLRLGGD